MVPAVVLLTAAGVAAAEFRSHPSVHFRKRSDVQGGGFELSNGLCRTLWSPDGGDLGQSYETNVGTSKHPEWLSLTARSSYEVQLRNFVFNYSTFKERLQFPAEPTLDCHGWGQGCGAVYSGNPWSGNSGEGTHFAVTGSGSHQCSVRFNVSITPSWQAQVAVTLRSGDTHVSERIEYRRLRADADTTSRLPGCSAALLPGTMSDARVRKVWRVQGLPYDMQFSFWSTISYVGWAWPGASFVVQTTRSGPWTPRSGGGAVTELGHWADNKVRWGPDYTVLHQAPPTMQTVGWISMDDVAVGETYTLEQNVVMRPGYHFDRSFLEYLWQLNPPAFLQPRYSMKYALDKMMYGLRYIPGGLRHYYTGDGIPFAFYAKDWYNGLAQNGQPTRQEVEHSPDWGGSWDAWIAVFLLQYKARYGDADGWINRTYTLIRNGLVNLPWNVDGGDLHGAIWEAWTEDRGMHLASFLGDQYSKYLWVCDSGKTGYMLLRLYQLTEMADRGLLRRAEGAGQFLLSIQQPDGDLGGSIYDLQSGQPKLPTNFAGVSSAVLLWAKLYEITRAVKWLDAAQRGADACLRKYLKPGAFQMAGGELDDVLFNASIRALSEGMYGVMALAELALVTRNASYVQMTRTVADYMLGWQWSRDINLGYYNSKMRFQGADIPTAGAETNGMVRCETTLFPLLAYKATGDRAYLDSFKHVFSFLTRAQWDNVFDARFFGGGDEGIQFRMQILNGFGSNFWGETVGQGVGILDYLLSKDQGMLG